MSATNTYFKLVIVYKYLWYLHREDMLDKSMIDMFLIRKYVSSVNMCSLGVVGGGFLIKCLWYVDYPSFVADIGLEI